MGWDGMVGSLDLYHNIDLWLARVRGWMRGVCCALRMREKGWEEHRWCWVQYIAKNSFHQIQALQSPYHRLFYPLNINTARALLPQVHHLP